MLIYSTIQLARTTFPHNLDPKLKLRLGFPTVFSSAKGDGQGR